MAGYPQRIQDKINLYTERLNSRYTYYKISDGYATSRDAQNDNVPITNIWTKSGSPSTGITVYSNIQKTTPVNGAGLWYNLFNSSDSSLSLVIQISEKGSVIDEISF